MAPRETENNGRFLFSQNFRNFRFGGKRNTFRQFSPLEYSKKKKENLKRWACLSRLEFPNGVSYSIYVSRSLHQFQVHRRAPRRTGVYDQMEQPFTNRKFHFCCHRNFRVFFRKWQAPKAYVKFWGDKQRALWYVMVFLECCQYLGKH